MQTDLNSSATKFINYTLQSIDERFGEDSRIMMDNISMFTKLNEYNNDEVLKNPLINLYCSPMHYNHKGTDHKILTTLPIGSNECERSFSTLQRIRTKRRNKLSFTALETAVKFSILKPHVTEADLDDIVQNFVMQPGRAKARSIYIYIQKNYDDSEDE
ncbi:unnamed protein product [Rotaria magnacalcarata]|uniref:HAT C-terminal dimerisation domain-containing protein n=1 Tax=Rotaria magnacalcarata TaxID=392030 RepID=A0A819NQX0_9BILA|nr:unnamed protein product [Rotaria magnacalcarata]CAF4001763.1 unnamed protein product [Rotaria magnacalcarata]CAF4312527.1 unnamed protein product [Rotaria magnacalcarata]CAF4628377.1 unnamed protein product [Rotaria magnacalcarata]CAF5172286.1 unnamed protein product [Rotaria magnacalcarata]